jgi:hypothetical protein
MAAGWGHTAEGSTETMANFTASLYYYPPIIRGLFITAGYGFSKYRLSTTPAATGTGSAMTVGLGYDLALGRRVLLEPVATYGYGDIGDVLLGDSTDLADNTYASRWKQNFLALGVGVILH